MHPKEAKTRLRFQSISSRFSTTFWTSKSDKEVLTVEIVTPNAKGCLVAMLPIRCHMMEM